MQLAGINGKLERSSPDLVTPNQEALTTIVLEV